MLSKLSKQDTMMVDGFEVVRGDIIKVKGEHGLKFKFDYFVTNDDTGSQWVDCFEIYRGISGVYRSFRLDVIKRVPKKRRKAKSVNSRNTTGRTPRRSKQGS